MTWWVLLIVLWKGLHCGGREEWISGNHAPQGWRGREREREGERRRLWGQRERGRHRQESEQSLENCLKYDWTLSYTRLLIREWKTSRKFVPNFFVIMDEIVPVTMIWTTSDCPESLSRICSGHTWSGPWQPPGPTPLPRFSLPWNTPPSPETSLPETLLPHFIIQVSHYQKDFLPRPPYPKYTFPCYFLSPLCWVIFVHSRNIIFNVSLSIVYLSLLHEDLDFIRVVFHYVPVT